MPSCTCGDMVSASTKETASLRLSMGGLGLRNAFPSRQAAHSASWGDCLEMIRDRCFHGWGMFMDRLTCTQQEQPHNIVSIREWFCPKWKISPLVYSPTCLPLKKETSTSPNMVAASRQFALFRWSSTCARHHVGVTRTHFEDRNWRDL